MANQTPLHEFGRADVNTSTTAIDVGLRTYMLRVYNYMAGGLALTGAVAFVGAVSGFYTSIAGTPML